MMAETFAMIKGTEAGARIRAAIVDMKGKLNMADWEGSSADVMGHVLSLIHISEPTRPY